MRWRFAPYGAFPVGGIKAREQLVSFKDFAPTEFWLVAPVCYGTVARPRIIGGSAKGRELKTPKRGTRPSPARLREALFNILAFRDPGRFLDVYAGSGAVGLEAASRGWRATCVDLSAEAVAVMRHNARALGLDVEVVKGDALAYARAQPQTFDVAFAAPPYPDDLAAIFQQLLDAAVVRPGGLYVFQHPAHLALSLETPWPTSLRRYGSNALTLVSVG